MTIEDVRALVKFKREYPSDFDDNETIAIAEKIDTDVAQPELNYVFSFRDGKLKRLSAHYKGKENIEKAESYLNQIANCQRVDKENEYGDRIYYCYYHNPEKNKQELAIFAKVKSPLKNDAPWAGIDYTFM